MEKQRIIDKIKTIFKEGEKVIFEIEGEYVNFTYRELKYKVFKVFKFKNSKNKEFEVMVFSVEEKICHINISTENGSLLNITYNIELDRYKFVVNLYSHFDTITRIVSGNCLIKNIYDIVETVDEIYKPKMKRLLENKKIENIFPELIAMQENIKNRKIKHMIK